jgi:hypothetical protein
MVRAVARVYVFADEGGDFVFARKPGASRYFLIATATMASCEPGERVLALRRELAWGGAVLHEFHAHNDKRRIRDRVFDVIMALISRETGEVRSEVLVRQSTPRVDGANLRETLLRHVDPAATHLHTDAGIHYRPLASMFASHARPSITRAASTSATV